MADFPREQVEGLIVSNVRDNADETVVTFAGGKTIRHRKRPLPEAVNTIQFLENQLTVHLNTDFSSVHNGPL